MTDQKYSGVDYGVFGAVTLVSLMIGIYFAFSGGRQRTTSEYLVGGRAMAYFPVAISLLVSFESSIMMLGSPAEVYSYGLQIAWSTLAYFLTNLLSINLIVPLIHPLKLTSAYEYLELRFQSRAVRLMGTVLGILSGTWYMGVVLYGPAIALEAVAGFPLWASIFGIAVVAVIYTSLGGLKAVIWTDVFQACIMYTGIFAILIKGTIIVGGPKEVWDAAQRGGRLNFFNFDPDPRVRHTFWNLFFAALVKGFGNGLNQSQVQRISATRTMGEAKKVLMIVAPLSFIAINIASYEGIVAYAFYNKRKCDPFESDQLENRNQLIPLAVMDMFPSLPGMPGLFLASLFSASLSTLSSGLSSITSLMWADIIHPLVGNISEVKATLIAKITVIIFGGFSCGIAFVIAQIGGTLTQITGSVLSAFGGPLAGILILAAFIPRANAKGALIGGITSFIVSLWISFGMNFSPAIKRWPMLPPVSTDMCYLYINTTDSSTYPPTVNVSLNTSYLALASTTVQPTEDDGPHGVEHLYTMSYTLLGPLGIILVVVIGMLGSLVTGMNKPGDVNPRCIAAISDTILVFLPKRWRRFLSSIGPQFRDKKYLAKFPDPAKRHDYREHELSVVSTENISPSDISKKNDKKIHTISTIETDDSKLSHSKDGL